MSSDDTLVKDKTPIVVEAAVSKLKADAEMKTLKDEWEKFIKITLVQSIITNDLDKVKTEAKRGSTSEGEMNTAADAVNAAITTTVSKAVSDAVSDAVEQVKNVVVEVNSSNMLVRDVKTKVATAMLAINKVIIGDILTVKGDDAKTEKTPVNTLYITSKGDNFSVSENKPSTPESNVFKMNLGDNGCWARDTAKAGGAMTKKRMRTTKRQLKGKRGLKSRVKSRVKTSRS